MYGLTQTACKDAHKDNMTTPSAEKDTDLERGRARDVTNILTT